MFALSINSLGIQGFIGRRRRDQAKDFCLRLHGIGMLVSWECELIVIQSLPSPVHLFPIIIAPYSKSIKLVCHI